MSYSIPYKDLGKGIEIILQNVNLLIDSASLLYSGKRFLHSATFSLLAIEEMTKAQLLIGYYDKKKDLPAAEWNRLTRGASAHKKKLREFLIRESAQSTDKITAGVSMEQIIELIVRYHVRLKQQVLYVNWDGRIGKWQWLPGQYSEKEQEEVSARLLDAAKKRYGKYQVA